MKKFWYISRDPSTVGYHDPKKAFFTIEDAKKEAESLCRKHGHDFYVMESVQLVKQSTPPIVWVEVTQNDAVSKGRKRDFLGRFTYEYDNDR